MVSKANERWPVIEWRLEKGEGERGGGAETRKNGGREKTLHVPNLKRQIRERNTLSVGRLKHRLIFIVEPMVAGSSYQAMEI